MCEILYAKIKHSDYENFYATCPYCEYENIFNRATDLGTFEPITFKQVKCFNPECGKSFNINGDLANAAFEMLVYDCYELLGKKKYSYCVLNLAQACEVFFSLYVYVTLAYRPFRRRDDDSKELNAVISSIYKNTEKYTYYKMKNIFINLIVGDINPADYSESKKIIANIKGFTSKPLKSKLENVKDYELKQLLLDLENSNISSLRNEVVHKLAYRPSEQEANGAIEEIRRVLFGLARKLEVLSDNINLK